jgi:RNA polymerase sigma-70 factor (ECF subfamily)
VIQPCSRVVPPRRLPSHLPVLRELESRGVPLERAESEDEDDYEARVETALMALFRDTGGEAEFQALYEYCRGALLVWIATHSRLRRGALRHADPLELLQDTFVNVYRYAASFRDERGASFRIWSRTIATNLIRRGSGRRALSLEAFPEGLQEPEDDRDDPACSLVRGEEQRALGLAWMIVLQQYSAAWSELGERDRKALELIEVEGLSYLEAGERMGVGLSNMKMIMFRARRRIRARIATALEQRRPPAHRAAAG